MLRPLDEHHLFIVSREAPEVARFLGEQFSVDSNVRVVLDRRHGERRRESARAADDRRGPDRRQRRDVEAELRRHTHVLVTVKHA